MNKYNFKSLEEIGLDRFPIDKESGEDSMDRNFIQRECYKCGK